MTALNVRVPRTPLSRTSMASQKLTMLPLVIAFPAKKVIIALNHANSRYAMPAISPKRPWSYLHCTSNCYNSYQITQLKCQAYFSYLFLSQLIEDCMN